MAEITLTPISPLRGASKTTGDTVLHEISDVTLISAAVPNGRETGFTKALTAGYGLTLPDPRMSRVKGGVRALQTGADQYMLMLQGTDRVAVADVAGTLKNTAYLTDQTDNWVMCALSGPGCVAVLERVCPIDLHEDAFPIGASARSVMEHMGVLILRVEGDQYWLLSASSSAKSFWHALAQSMDYALG